jgi:periplasmic protein TonB
VTTIGSGSFDRKPPWRLWALAAAGALALHIGGVALAIARLSTDGSGDALGANAIEIGVELASSHQEDNDLPPGPDADASVASPPAPDQKAEIKPTDLPQDTPDKTEDPDRVVTENKSQKPTEDDPKEQTVQTTASPESNAQVATAQQTFENARESTTTTAPNIGLGKDNQVLTAEWGRKISAYLKLHLRYPEVVKNKNVRVIVSLVLNRLGHVQSAVVSESSGEPAFDEAALSMVRRSDPVPRPPAKLTDDQFSFSLPVDFVKPK